MKFWCLVFFSLVIIQVKAEDGFVKTSGLQFVLNGKPWYTNGFNAYWLMFEAAEPSERYKISSVFQEAANHGLSVARTWAFSDGGFRALQFSPGKYNEQTFQGLDFVISEAKKYGIKLVMSLVNGQEGFGGKKQYVEWGRSQGQSIASEDDFYTNSVVKGFYKNHIKTVLTRRNTVTGISYKDDPTIMAWELINEPRCVSDKSGNTLQAWITEMASYLKSVDTNHLLEVGLEGFYGQSHSERQPSNPNFRVGTDFIANNQISTIDFATVHSYPGEWLPGSSDETQLSFLKGWIDNHTQDAQNILQKPVIFGEFGKKSTGPGFNMPIREAVFNAVYSVIFSSAKSGGPAASSIFWQLLTQGTDNLRDGYEVLFSESPSMASIIAQQSEKLKSIARLENDEKWKNGEGSLQTPKGT